MDFLSYLTSLALGEIPAIKPLLPVLTSQSNNGSKFFNEADRERSNTFGRNDPLEENQIQQKINFNSLANEQKELKDYEKIIPVKGKRISPFDKNFSDESKSISDETNDLTKSIKPAEQNIQSNNLSFAEENREGPFETTAVTSTTDVLQSINDLFVGGETVLKLKNTVDKKENRFEMHSVNPQSKAPKNILDDENKNSGINVHVDNNVKTSTIKINIGRIEVRAVYPEQVISSKAEENKPQLTLNDYLRSFNEGKR